MALDGFGITIGIVLTAAVYAVGIYIAYVIMKAAVRNGTIEAYIKLRREKLYPPEQ